MNIINFWENLFSSAVVQNLSLSLSLSLSQIPSYILLYRQLIWSASHQHTNKANMLYPPFIPFFFHCSPIHNPPTHRGSLHPPLTTPEAKLSLCPLAFWLPRKLHVPTAAVLTLADLKKIDVCICLLLHLLVCMCAFSWLICLSFGTFQFASLFR